MTLPSAAYLRFPQGSRWVVKIEKGKGSLAVVKDHDFSRGLIGLEFPWGFDWATPEQAEENLEPAK